MPCIDVQLCPTLSCVWLFAAWWTVACQAPLSMRFSRQEYWNGFPFTLGIFLIQESNPCLLHCQVNSFPLSHLGSPCLVSEANISHSVLILVCCFGFGLCRESLNGVSDLEVLFTCMLCYCIALYWYGGKVLGSSVVLWIGLSFLNLICVSLLLFEGWRELELGKVLPGQLCSVKIIFFSDCPF